MGDWSFGEGGKAGTALSNYQTTLGTAMKNLAPTYNTKAGSLAQLDILPNFDSELALVSVEKMTTNANLIEIGFGTMPAHIIMENLLGMSFNGGYHNYLFPLALPAGRMLYGRNQVAPSQDTGPRVNIRTFSRGLASFPIAGSIVLSYGVVTSGATRGTAIDPGAVANVKGAWTQLGVLTKRAIYLNVGFHKAGGTTDLPVWLIDIGIGPAGSEVVLLPNLPARHQHNDHTNAHVHGPFPVNLPTGTRLSARVACDSGRAGDRTCDIVAHATS